MRNSFYAVLLLSAFVCGCGDDEGQVLPGDVTTWMVEDLIVVKDECNLHDPDDPFSGTFEIAIDGSTVTMAHTEFVLEATAYGFSQQDDEVALTGTTRDTEDPPCTVEFTDEFVVVVANTNLRLENNDTLTVTWNHNEDDVSEEAEACTSTVPPIWDVGLPCEAVFTFTLTKI